jgi:hypothetical protein
MAQLADNVRELRYGWLILSAIVVVSFSFRKDDWSKLKTFSVFFIRSLHSTGLEYTSLDRVRYCTDSDRIRVRCLPRILHFCRFVRRRRDFVFSSRQEIGAVFRAFHSQRQDFSSPFECSSSQR